MNYQGVVRRSALSGVYTPCRIRIERRCAESVNGLGRECDKSALPYYLRCPLDILLALGIEQQCVFTFAAVTCPTSASVPLTALL